VKYRTPAADDALYEPLLPSNPTNEQSGSSTPVIAFDMSSYRMISIISIHAVGFLPLAIIMLVAPEADATEGFAPRLVQAMLMEIFHWICALLSLALVIALCIFQIRQARSAPQTSSLHVFALVLQVLVLLVLAFLQAFRPTSGSTGTSR
jgi:hypothetical protein